MRQNWRKSVEAFPNIFNLDYDEKSKRQAYMSVVLSDEDNIAICVIVTKISNYS